MLSSNRILRNSRPSTLSRLCRTHSGFTSLPARQFHRGSRRSNQASAQAQQQTEPESRKWAFEAPNKGRLPSELADGVASKSHETPSEFTATAVVDGATDAGTKIKVTSSTDFLQIEDQDNGGWTRLYASTLRDSCTCPKCTDPSSGQKNFASTDVPAIIEIKDIRLADNGVGISFRNDIERLARGGGHEMVLPWDTVEKALGHRNVEKMVYPRQDAVYPKTGRTFWDTETIEKRIRRIDYHEFMKGEDAFWQVLLDLTNLGLVFLKNVPHDETSIASITERIANIKSTFYGRTFDVRAKPDAENVAYTSGYLGLHQDLLYLQSPPAVQLLHCMENSCSGGESLFSDGLRAGKLLWLQENRDAIANLADVHVPYHYEKFGYWYKQKRPLLSTTAEGVLASVYWSPPFQDRFPIPSADLRAWLEPAQLFDALINAETAMYQVKMKPGECVLFDNLRVMHGRRAFDASGGSRWLRGAYIEREDLVSRALHIPERLAVEYRGGETWTRESEDQKLKASKAFEDVTKTAEGMMSGLRERGLRMDVKDHMQLNGEFVNSSTDLHVV